MKKTTEKQWTDAIAKAKHLYSTSDTLQMEIATIATNVCEITWGGVQHKDKYTLSKFAKETGIHFKTLSRWVAIKRAVFDKIKRRELKKTSFTTLARVAVIADKDATSDRIEALIAQESKDTIDKRIIGYLANMASLYYSLESDSGALTCNEETIEETLFYLGACLDCIKRERPKVIAKDNNLVRAFRRNLSVSAANVLGVERNHDLSLSAKDMDIVKYLLKNEGPFSPTDIGMKVGQHNRSSASAWSLRTLTKLVYAGFLIQNERKLYVPTEKFKPSEFGLTE